MKNAPVVLLTLLTLSFAAAPAFAQTNTLAALGTNNFTVDEGSTTAAYSQTATNLTLVSPFTLGDTLGGVFSSTYDWSAYSNTNNFTFGLYMSAAGASPGIPFNVELFNAALDAIVATYSGDAAGLGASSTFIPMSFQVGGGSGDLSSIGGMQFTWNGGGTGTVVVDSIAVAVVPEPSTWALLLLSAALCGGLVWRRHRLAVARR
jgi:hypothetical protein